MRSSDPVQFLCSDLDHDIFINDLLALYFDQPFQKLDRAVSMMVLATSRHNRRPTIFEGPRSPSLRLLQGLERAVPPSADSPRILPSPKTLKPLPPVPTIETSNSEPTISVVPLRSSSFDTGSPGTWEPPPSWSHNEQKMPDHPLDYGYHEPFSVSSPQLTMKEPALPILEPRTYAPLLPEPSPSLTTTSRRSSDLHIITQLSPVNQQEQEQLWADLPPSPPSPEAESAEPLSPEPQLLPPPRILHLRSQASTESLPSPSTPTYGLPNRARSSSPPSDRLKGPWSAGIAKVHDSPSQTPSRLKGPWSPRIAHTIDAESASPAHLEGPWSPGVAHTRDESIEKALSNLGINKDGSENTRGRTYTRTHKKVTSQEDKKDDDLLSGNYHDALVEQYRSLAAPTVGRWDESSDDEQAAGNFRLVPKPLFWMQKGREGSALKIDEQRYEALRSLPGGQQRRASLSTPPLKLMLPGHYRSKSDESGKSPDMKQRRRSGILRSPKGLLARRSRGSKEKNHIGTSTPLQLELPKSVTESPCTSLDRAALKTGMDDPVRRKHPQGVWSGVIQSVAQSQSDPKEESPMPSQFTDFSQLDLPDSRSRTASSHIKNVSADTTHSVYSQTSGRSSASYPRPMERNPTVAVRERPENHKPAPSPLNISTSGQSTGFRGMLQRARDSISPIATSPRSPQRRSHLSTASSDYSSKRDSKATTNGEEDKDVFRLPGFVEKAFEARREQAREKRREELKKKIKVVGEADLGRDIEYDPLNRRRETFGEGWI